MRNESATPMRADVVDLAEYRAASRKRQAKALARPVVDRPQRGQDELALDALTLRSKTARRR